MTDDEAEKRIRELRGRGLSPGEIARNLQIKPAVVSGVVRKLAAERDATGHDTDCVECLLNAGWSTGLGIDGHPEWHDPMRDDTTGGLVTAVVARRRRHRSGATVCLYLLDVYCLGVKDAIGPNSMGEEELRAFTRRVFSGYRTAPVVAPIELVRDLVFGACDYARGLGFAPHRDFDQARPHLGAWTGPSSVTFGRDGRPTYVSGPYDDSDHILATLSRAVGRDGFGYTTAVNVDDVRLAG